MKQTAVQQIIEKFEYIKENHCKSLQEVVFFDGILAILESGKYKEMEQQQIIDTYISGYTNGVESMIDENLSVPSPEEYYNSTFKSE